MLYEASMCRLHLGAQPGIMPALNGGLDAWGHAGLERYYSGTGTETVLASEIVKDGSGWWYEVGFISPERLDGNASTGWTYRNDRLHVWLEWSEDLINWSTGPFVDAPGNPVPVLGGFAYSARSIYTQDSLVKTGAMLVTSTTDAGDSRNNPLTALTVKNVVQTLAHAPYTMPTDAALLQTDLRAIGWTGATVVATTDVDWQISLPTVDFTAYNTITKIFWPSYLVPNDTGAVVNPCDGFLFAGTYIDPNRFRCALNKQFARLGIRKF